MTTDEKIEKVCDAVALLTRRLYNVIGGETYYEVCEKLNEVVEDIENEKEN